MVILWCSLPDPGSCEVPTTALPPSPLIYPTAAVKQEEVGICRQMGALPPARAAVPLQVREKAQRVGLMTTALFRSNGSKKMEGLGSSSTMYVCVCMCDECVCGHTCVHVCMCMCMCTCVCMCRHAHSIHRSQRSASGVMSWEPSTFYLRQGLSMAWNLSSRLRTREA